MYSLLLTIVLQSCSTCEVIQSTHTVVVAKDKFSCNLVGRRIIQDYEINENEIKQYAQYKCEKVK